MPQNNDTKNTKSAKTDKPHKPLNLKLEKASNNTPVQKAYDDAGDFMKVNLGLFDFPNCSLSKSTDDEVREQIKRYFEYYAQTDHRPTVAGLAFVLDTDRRRLWEIVNGVCKLSLTPGKVDLIKKAYRLLEMNMETALSERKIDPVSGIFLSKNNFGYVDKVEHVITPNQPEELDVEEIKKRYELPE